MRSHAKIVCAESNQTAAKRVTGGRQVDSHRMSGDICENTEGDLTSEFHVGWGQKGRRHKTSKIS